MREMRRDCRAAEVGVGDWLPGWVTAEGRVLAGRVLAASRVRTGRIDVEVDGVAVGVPGTDRVVLRLAADGEEVTLELRPDQFVTRGGGPN